MWAAFVGFVDVEPGARVARSLQPGRRRPRRREGEVPAQLDGEPPRAFHASGLATASARSRRRRARSRPSSSGPRNTRPVPLRHQRAGRDAGRARTAALFERVQIAPAAPGIEADLLARRCRAAPAASGRRRVSATRRLRARPPRRDRSTARSPAGPATPGGARPRGGTPTPAAWRPSTGSAVWPSNSSPPRPNSRTRTPRIHATPRIEKTLNRNCLRRPAVPGMAMGSTPELTLHQRCVTACRRKGAFL